MSELRLQSESTPKECDVLVIGAGIGGLACANYLAKSGAKVVLVEKHHCTGGYVTSFKKGGYQFDAAAHSLGSCRPEGQVGRLISDHKLWNELELIRYDPADVVMTRNHEVLFYNDVERDITELQSQFPLEAEAVERFIRYVRDTDSLQLFAELNGQTFAALLDQYFRDIELKSTFSILLGNIGLPSSTASALTAAFLYREFIFDHGYYPRGGMQKFADILLDRFISYGGIAMLLTPAIQIELSSQGRVKMVRVNYQGHAPVDIKVKAIAANCDPFQLERMISKPIWKKENKSPKDMVQSISAYMLHLGVRGNLDKLKHRCSLWSYRLGHVDQYWEKLFKGVIELGRDSFLFFNIPSMHDPKLAPEGCHSIQVIIPAPFMDKPFWERYESVLEAEALTRLGAHIPGFSGLKIEVKRSATPMTLAKYTGNYRGAMYGWASITGQVGRTRMPSETGIAGLYLVGHWTGLPSGYSGIPTVVTSGRHVSRIVLKELSRN